jgi:hypothetical protein
VLQSAGIRNNIARCKEMPRTLFRSGRHGVERPGIDDTPDALPSSEPHSEDPQPESRELHRVEATLLKPAEGADTLKAVCAHIAQHPEDPSSRVLAALIRALHENASAFSFETLDCLGPVTRKYAERLISGRLWGAFPEAEWQQAVAAVTSFELKDAVSKLTTGAKAPEPSVAPTPRLAATAKPSVEPTPLPEPRLATSHRGAVEPILRPESRLAPTNRSAAKPVMLPTNRPPLQPRGLSAERDESAQRVASAGGPQPEPFNLENVGRHWRVMLWLGMAVLGLSVVLYL